MKNSFFIGIGIWIAYLLAANIFLESRLWLPWFNLPTTYSNPLVIVPIAIFINVLPLFVLAIVTAYFGKKEQQHREYLFQTGKKAKATVINTQDTGTTINQNPVIKLTLKIQSDSFGKELEVTIQKMIPRIAIPRVGDILNISYDPANIQDLVILL